MVGSKDLQPLTTPFFPNIFVKNQFRTKPQWPPKTTNLSGKVALITGGNTGLGFECGRQLLSYKLSRLIITSRSAKRGEDAAAKLLKRYPGATIDVWALDMSSYDSIQALAKRAESELARLDIVILNGGVGKAKLDIVSTTGHEEDIQINYLSTVFTAILLLPVLKAKSPAGTPGRLTIVNAALALAAKFPNRNKTPLLSSFDDPKSFDANDQYCSSKLLAHLFLYKLVDYVSADDVVVNLVDPGFVKGTELARGVHGFASLISSGFSAIAARPTPVGACTYVDAAVVKGKESHGCFIMSWKITPFHSLLYTTEGKTVIERLWQETMNEFAFANVRGIIESMKSS
ncbi:hypothetical protein F5884DRAFT_856877 [Xylogone sp. PMI_703]|nr:hypothetical protein F5884DRAFT_856877 [Xylogone sp. PMI_703]